MRKPFLLLLTLIYSVISLYAIPGDTTRLTNWDYVIFNKAAVLPPARQGDTANIGLAGVFSGKVDGKFIVAGGANFPEGLPAAGGKKVWWDDIYTFDNINGWKIFKGALRRNIAYGVSIETKDGLLCIGGCDSSECLNEAFIISLNDGSPVIRMLPSLPVPLSNSAGAMIGSKVYIAGGQESMATPMASKNFLVIDLANLSAGWRRLKSWEGPARSFAVATAQSNGYDNCFYLFSGRYYKGNSPWNVLSDGWCYNPRIDRWKRIDNSFPVMAGAALPFGANHILFIGGHSKAPEYNGNRLRLYHTVTNTIIDEEAVNITIPVTSCAVKDDKGFMVISGEVSPGVRTPDLTQGDISSEIKRLTPLDIIIIVLYFMVLSLIGWHFSKKQKSTEDYFKGGGRIPWIIIGLSIFGTSLSAITFMSIPAKAYATDWSYMLFNAGIIMVVPIITLLFIPFYRKLNVTTAYEYLEKRFNPLIRVICSMAFILFQIGRMGVVLLLPSIALNVVTGFDIFLCISLMGVLSLVYTMMGGIEAVAWTDAMQVVVLLGAAIAVVYMICGQLPDGIESILSTAASNHKFNLGSTAFDLRQPALWTVLIATFFTNITTYGTDQTIVQRYISTETEKQARKGVYTNALLTIPSTVIFFFLGTAIYVFYKFNPAELSLSISDGDAILPWYVSTQMPSGILGLVISGIFAAAMSTLSSSMNSAATAYFVDIHSKIFSNKEKNSLKSARVATMVIGVTGILFALLMATWDIKSLWDEFSKILGILLGGLGGLFLLGLITKRANSTGALCGIIASIAVQMIVINTQAVNLLLYSSTGFVTCFIVGYLCSVITGGNKQKEIRHLTIYRKQI
ncbi:MAG: sodium/solute symporter [Bacteroidales bacterium]|nr:sodium/solute symporter [Bacteroidales bacterium]